MVVEGGGFGGPLARGNLNRPELKGKNIVVPLCGGNIDTTTLSRVIDRGLATAKTHTSSNAHISREGGDSDLSYA